MSTSYKQMPKSITSLDSVFEIIGQMNNREIFEERKKNKKAIDCFKKCFKISFAFFLAALILGFANKWIFKSRICFVVSLVLLLISYLFVLLQPFIIVWFYRKIIFNLIFRPFNFFLGEIKDMAKIDYEYIELLKDEDVYYLRYIKLIMSTEKQSIEKRISLFIGTIEKIGIFPGMLAIFAILFRTVNNVSKEFSDWIYVIAYLNPVIYFLGVYIHSILWRLDKTIKILDYVVEEKQKYL